MKNSIMRKVCGLLLVVGFLCSGTSALAQGRVWGREGRLTQTLLEIIQPIYPQVIEWVERGYQEELADPDELTVFVSEYSERFHSELIPDRYSEMEAFALDQQQTLVNTYQHLLVNWLADELYLEELKNLVNFVQYALYTHGVGDRIAFISDRDGKLEIYTMNILGDDIVRLTDTPGNDESFSPRFSPDGRRIAYRRGNKLWWMHADGGNQTATDIRLITNPSWSPDGQWIACNVTFGPYTGGTSLTNITGTEAISIRNSDYYSLAFSPDGKSILAVSDNSIFQLPISGGDPIRLTSPQEVNSGSPAWSPDGSLIAFASSRTGNWDIYLMNPDGEDVVNLTQSLSDEWGPVWSPDGSRIAFSTYRDEVSEIYIMNADGTDPYRLTDSPSSDQVSSWSRIPEIAIP